MVRLDSFPLEPLKIYIMHAYSRSLLTRSTCRRETVNVINEQTGDDSRVLRFSNIWTVTKPKVRSTKFAVWSSLLFEEWKTTNDKTNEKTIGNSAFVGDSGKVAHRLCNIFHISQRDIW